MYIFIVIDEIKNFLSAPRSDLRNNREDHMRMVKNGSHLPLEMSGYHLWSNVFIIRNATHLILEDCTIAKMWPKISNMYPILQEENDLGYPTCKNNQIFTDMTYFNLITITHMSMKPDISIF